MATALPQFPSFSVHENASDIRWRKWINRLENMLVGMDITDDNSKRALLLHYAGEEVSDIFETLVDTGNTYATAKQKLTDYFAPKKNTEYEVYKFRQAKQDQSETIDTFQTRLGQLSINCEFASVDNEIKSQIIQGCFSTRLRRRALREEMDLDKLLASARALELSEKQASEIEKTEASQANVLRRKPRLHKTNKRTFAKNKSHFKPSNKQCRNCGGEYPHQNGLCPAHDKNCRFCSIKGHFESCCRKKHQNQKRKTVNHMDNYYQNYGTNNNDNDSSEEEAYLFGLEFGESNKVAKIRNRYNQVPHLTQDTNGKVTNSQKTPQTRAKRSALSQQVTTKHI